MLAELWRDGDPRLDAAIARGGGLAWWRARRPRAEQLAGCEMALAALQREREAKLARLEEKPARLGDAPALTARIAGLRQICPRALISRGSRR